VAKSGCKQSADSLESTLAPPVNARLQHAANCSKGADGVFRGDSPYVFMEQSRWDYYRQTVEEGRWKDGQDLVNNVLRRFKTLCRRAGVGRFTIHDLRRSCITNWARALPIHVVKQLAGHSDIDTTQKFYLSIQPEDIVKAQKVQSDAVANVPKTGPDDSKAREDMKRLFPGKQAFHDKKPVVP